MRLKLRRDVKALAGSRGALAVLGALLLGAGTLSAAPTPPPAPPSADAALERLEQPPLDQLDDGDEGKRVGEDRGDVEQLEVDAELEADAVRAAEQLDLDHYFPVSAKTGDGVPELVAHLVERLPEGPQYYPDDMVTDVPEAFWVAELVREQLLAVTHDELPHSIAVVVDEMAPRAGRDGLIDVYAVMYVERPSQKAIVIGAGGARLKEVGTRARHQIEALLGTRVYLDLRVKIAKDWQRNPKQLRRLGFYD